jgi:nucleoside-diphosphate kinase
MVDELVSGPCLAMELTHPDYPSTDDKPSVVNAFRSICGPHDPELARQVNADSLRARFGLDKVRNAVHCTDLAEDGKLEVHYFFRILGE